jgi:hypothetical protein
MIVKRFYAVRWLTDDGEFHEQEHTAKPTAMGHMRALRRNPKVKGAGLFDITQSKTSEAA